MNNNVNFNPFNGNVSSSSHIINEEDVIMEFFAKKIKNEKIFKCTNKHTSK